MRGFARWTSSAALLLWSAWATAAPSRVMVAPLSASEASPRAVAQVERAIREELLRSANVELVQEEGAPTCGAQDLACLLGVAKARGAAEVLVSEVRGLPDSYAITLRIVRVDSAGERARSQESVNRSDDELVAGIRAQLVKLESPERFVGRLVVHAAQDAKVEVDGRPQTGTAMLPPGLHAVRVVTAAAEAKGDVEVRFEQTADVVAEGTALKVEQMPWVGLPLTPSPSPQVGPPRWPGYAALGLGAALLVGGVVQEIRASSIRSDIDAARDPEGGIRRSAQGVPELLSSYSAARTSGAAMLASGGLISCGGGAWLLWFAGPGVGVGGSF